MKKTVPLYEVIILALLLIFAVYYFVLYQPTEKELDDIEAEKSQTQTMIEVQQSKLMEQRKMENAIDAAYEAANGAPVPIPEYNNVNTVIAELHAILGGAASYSIDFDDEVAAEPIMTRDISITCTVETYEQAMAIVKAIHDSPNACFIRDLSWTDRWADQRLRYGDGIVYNEVLGPITDYRTNSARYSVNMEVRCYEYAG